MSNLRNSLSVPRQISKLIPLLMLVVVPIMGMFRNPDLLHDGYFYAMARGLNSGLMMHEDIYNHYGPLVPWLISVQMQLTGENLTSVRILGAAIVCAISILVFITLKLKVGTKSALLLVLAWQLLDGSRSQMESPRWIWGTPIWPTNIAILLTLILVLFFNRILNPPKNSTSRKMSIYSIFAGGIGAFLPYSRIQGFVTYCVVATFIFYAIYVTRNVSLARSFVISSMFVHVFVFTYVIKVSTVDDFAYQQFISPFSAAESVMQNRWSGWILSLLVSMVIGILGSTLLIVLAKVLFRVTKPLSVSLVIAACISIPYYFSSQFDFPSRFNGDLKLWAVKGFSMLPIWFWWSWFLSGSLFLLFKFLRCFKEHEIQSKISRVSITGNVIVFLSLLSHLFWNYSYIYILLPILLVMVSANSQIRFKSSINSMEFQSLALGTVTAFGLVFLMGLAIQQERFTSEELKSFSRNVSYAASLDSELKTIKNAIEEGQSSQFYCETQFFRVWDVNSFIVDKKFYFDRPKDFISYVAEVDQADTILYCDPDTATLESINMLSSGPDWRLTSEPVVNARFNVYVLKREQMVVGGG